MHARPPRPRLDHELFASAPGVHVVTFADIAAEEPSLLAALKRDNLVHCAPPVALFGGTRRYDAVVASNEDVGIPTGVDAWANGVDIPLFLIGHGHLAAFRHLSRKLAELRNLHYLFISEAVRRLTLHDLDLPVSRTHVIGWPVDTEFYQPSDLPPERLVVGAGTAHRDYATLLRAVRSLPADVVIAADSQWTARPLDIASCAVPSNVQVRSCESFTALRGLYSRATCVVVPVYPVPHACGYAVISEAMAMAKPVVATRTEAVSDFIVDGETGYYVSPGDADDLKAKIASLLDDPARAAAMGRAGRRRIEELYSVEEYTSRLRRVIEANVSTRANAEA